jgi:hypothetical protein
MRARVTYSFLSLASHIAATRQAERSKWKQPTLPALASSTITAQSTFTRDLCELFLAANIPLHKLSNDKVRSFLGKYTTHHVPSESTVRKTQVTALYEEVLHGIREKIGSNYVYISVDETTDARGNYVANLIAGALTLHEAGAPFLIASSELERTNAATVSTFVNDAFIRFYAGEPFSSKILLLVTDAAPYMGLAGRNLTQLYPNLIHVTCIAHAVHRVCKKVREMFPDVNRLISSAQKIFLKAPSRCDVYKQYMSCPLPPDVVITRWGTWLTAAIFYASHFENFSTVIHALPDDSKYTSNVKLLLQKDTLASDLAFIQAYLHFLPDVIRKLEGRGLGLNAQLAMVEDVQSKIALLPGSRGVILKRKADSVFEKNTGLSLLREINDSLVHGTAPPPSMSPALLSAYTYAPIVSVEVERSFSEYKALLSDRRMSFTSENIEKHLVVQHNVKFL